MALKLAERKREKKSLFSMATLFASFVCTFKDIHGDVQTNATKAINLYYLVNGMGVRSYDIL